MYNDTSKPDSYQSMIDTVVAAEGRIDGLVNNFGGTNPAEDKDLLSTSYEHFLAGVDANVGSVFLGYVTGLRPDFAPGSEDESNLTHAVKNAWTLLGAVAALLPMYLIERTYIRFDTRAPWYGQILKLVLGLALAVGLKTMLKEPLRTLFPSGFADALRYFVLVLYAGCVWPLTFRFFARLGRKAD